MKTKTLIFGMIIGALSAPQLFAATLQGTASVNITSDTATNAKNMAFDEARRQIIRDTLRQYSIEDQLLPVLQNAKSSELTNLITSSSIDGEKLSDTTYSANITMTVDSDAAQNWLTENNVQNWLNTNSNETVIVIINMSDGIANWMELQKIARDEKVELATKYMTGNQATVEIPKSVRNTFTIALRESGWQYANQDGALRIWK
jgi:hypothetical protein